MGLGQRWPPAEPWWDLAVVLAWAVGGIIVQKILVLLLAHLWVKLGPGIMPAYWWMEWVLGVTWVAGKGCQFETVEYQVWGG